MPKTLKTFFSRVSGSGFRIKGFGFGEDFVQQGGNRTVSKRYTPWAV